jgi:hypothetical protein
LSTDLAVVEQNFVAAGVPQQLATELLEAYVEAKRRYYLGDHRPNAVEGGRFSEAALRIVQHESGLAVTPVGKSLPAVNDQMLARFEAATSAPEAVRFHIPRALKTIYGIRNKRDAAHLADGIDPNLQDATLIVGNMDWVLAEFVRIYHQVSADDAQQIIENLVSKEVPAVQEIHGQPVILSDLAPRDQALLLLYRAGSAGASIEELMSWLRAGHKGNMRKRLAPLDEGKRVLLHPKDGRYYITHKGIRDVEKRQLAKPATS